MMEKVMVAKSRDSNSTIICGTRYGNVMASRGSVIPLFVNQIQAGKHITVTDPNMTRFMMTLDEAADLVLFAFQNGKSGDIFVQKAPATSISILVEAIKDLLGLSDYPVDIIGTRHGEKLYEVLLSREEMVAASEMDRFFCIPPDLRDLNYGKFIEKGEKKISRAEDYNSHNTVQLDIFKMKEMLKQLPFMQAILDGNLSPNQE